MSTPKKKETLQSVLSKPTAQLWIDFAMSYWHLLSKENRDSYLIDMIEGKAPPQITLDDLTDIEASALRQHQGSIIQLYRKKNKMTIEDIATLLGKQKSYLSLVESGQRMLTVVDMYRLMHAIGIPATEMFRLDIKVPSPPTVEKI